MGEVSCRESAHPDTSNGRGLGRKLRASPWGPKWEPQKQVPRPGLVSDSGLEPHGSVTKPFEDAGPWPEKDTIGFQLLGFTNFCSCLCHPSFPMVECSGLIKDTRKRSRIKEDLVGLLWQEGLAAGLDEWPVCGGPSTLATLPTGLGSPQASSFEPAEAASPQLWSPQVTVSPAL